MSSLRLDWCSHEAAKYAILNWHYSAVVPKGFPQVRVGVWESEKFVGAVVFGRGASDALLKPYGLDSTEGAELVRVALRKHEAPVSRIVAISLRMLRQRCPGLRLVVSFADPMQGHVGSIYKAGGWVYAGLTAPDCFYIDRAGRRWHSRNVSSTGVKLIYGRPTRSVKPAECLKVVTEGKHRYLMPLDADMRRRVAHLAKPYPKRPSRRPLEIEGTPDQGDKGAEMRPVGSTLAIA